MGVRLGRLTIHVCRVGSRRWDGAHPRGASYFAVDELGAVLQALPRLSRWTGVGGAPVLSRRARQGGLVMPAAGVVSFADRMVD
jgi:hypothetical protein